MRECVTYDFVFDTCGNAFFLRIVFGIFFNRRSMLAKASTVRAVVIVEVRMRMLSMRTRMLLRLTCIHDLKTYVHS